MREKPITHLREFETQIDDWAEIDRAFSECEEIDKRSQKSGFVSAPDATRKNTLISKISLLKERGIHADELRKAELNHSLIADGKRPLNFKNELSRERARLVHSYRMIAGGREARDVQEAGQVTVTPQGGSSGSFVPVEFIYSGLQNALKSYSPLFDPDKCTFITTETGRPTMVPLSNDTNSQSNPVSEGVDDSTYLTIQGTSSSLSTVQTFRTPKIATTIEWGEDSIANMHVGFLEDFFAGRHARGVGDALVNGTGSLVGLVNSLVFINTPHTIAAGSASDDGGVETGATTVGSQDLRNLFYSVDRAYRNSPKAAWLMQDSTLNAIDGLRDKQGHLQHLIKWGADGQPRLFGAPVYCEPNLSAIGPSNIPIVYGDLSRWLTRYVPAASYVQRYSELPGFAENGMVAWQSFARFGGQLLFNGNDSAQTPISYLQNFS